MCLTVMLVLACVWEWSVHSSLPKSVWPKSGSIGLRGVWRRLSQPCSSPMLSLACCLAAAPLRMDAKLSFTCGTRTAKFAGLLWRILPGLLALVVDVFGRYTQLLLPNSRVLVCVYRVPFCDFFVDVKTWDLSTRWNYVWRRRST